MAALARRALGLWCVMLALGGPLVQHASAQSLAERGEQIFDAHCAACHGERISNPNNLFDLKELRTDERARFDKSVREGKGQMPAWEGTFSDEEFDALWAYIRSVAD